MKSFLLLIIISFILCTNSYSQFSNNYDYTISAPIYTIRQMPKVFNQNTQHFTGSYLNGGMVKFNDNQLSYRLSGYYLNQNMDYNDDCINCELAKGKMTDYAFKLGFEKNLSYARIQPYFGIDMGYRNNSFTGMMTALDMQKNVSTLSRVEATKTGFTAGPLIGLKVNPFPMITLFAESSLEFFYSYERRQTVTQDAMAVKTFNKTYQTEFLLNPVALGIQIHLGAKN